MVYADCCLGCVCMSTWLKGSYNQCLEMLECPNSRLLGHEFEMISMKSMTSDGIESGRGRDY
jgi:hypothetical protein